MLLFVFYKKREKVGIYWAFHESILFTRIFPSANFKVSYTTLASPSVKVRMRKEAQAGVVGPEPLSSSFS